MHVQEIIEALQERYPGKACFKLPEENPSEIICELEPSSAHPAFSRAIAVISKSAPHFHAKTTETYKVIKGVVTLFVDGKKVILKGGEEYTIKPGAVHWAESDAAWVEAYSTPGWTPDDHVLVKEQSLH